MSFKKNAVSYSIWMLFIMCNGIVFSFLSMLYAKIIPAPMPIAALGLTAAFFGLLFLIYLLTGVISRSIVSKRSTKAKQNMSSKQILDASVNEVSEVNVVPEEYATARKREASAENRIRRRLIWEGIVAVAILAAGVCLRIYMLPLAGESAAYYDVAKVTSDGAAIMVPVQNGIYYYLCVLHGMFTLIGNHWIAGIWLQIVLQVLGSLVLYFAVRKLAGAFVAVTTLAFGMFSPTVLQESLNYSPQLFWLFLWAHGLLGTALFLNSSARSGEREKRSYGLLMWLGALLLGLIIGFLIYVDVSGVVLIVPLLFLPIVCRERKRCGIWVGRMIFALFAAVAGFFGAIYVDGIVSGSVFDRVLNAWLVTYQQDMPDVIALLQSSSVEVIVLLVVMAVNVFAFCRRKGREILTLWLLMTFIMAALYVFGITTESMNGRILLFMLMSVVAAIGIRELFYVNKVEHSISMVSADNGLEEAEGSGVPEVSEISENCEASATDNVVLAVEATTVVETVQTRKPRFLDNPLPLPKKHVKKVMDYAFIPEASEMNYDVDVAATDDFDL